MAAVDAPPPPVEPDLEEASLTVDGVEWVVRVVGRSGGTLPSAIPLLLLGFWDDGEGKAERTREALVVARSLASMTPAALSAAFETSVPPPPPREPRDDQAGRRGRGTGGRSGGRR